MKKLGILLSLILLIASASSQAAMITNGDFSSCDFTGWNKDTDGFGDVSVLNDFAIEGAAPDCQAAINVDYQDTEAFFANTLYQAIDLTAMATSELILSFDLSVSSELSSLDLGFIADYFVVGLNDGSGNLYDANGQLGTLFEADIDGADSYQLSYSLDSSLFNQTGWFLDFQLLLGADDTGFTDLGGSSLFVDNVSLQQVQVPAPQGISLFFLGLFAVMMTRKKHLASQANSTLLLK